MRRSRDFGALTAAGAASADDFSGLAIAGVAAISNEHTDISRQQDARAEAGFMANQALTNLQERHPGLPQLAQIQRGHMDVVTADQQSARVPSSLDVKQGPAAPRVLAQAYKFPTPSPFGNNN